MGIDVGSKRVGVALSDPLHLTAQAHSVVAAGGSETYSRLAGIADAGEVERIVVGLPIGLSGSEGGAAGLARAFGRELGERTGLPVVFVDERFTTKMAEDVLVQGGVKRATRKRIRDKMAAAILLQSYLDALP